MVLMLKNNLVRWLTEINMLRKYWKDDSKRLTHMVLEENRKFQDILVYISLGFNIVKLSLKFSPRGLYFYFTDFCFKRLIVIFILWHIHAFLYSIMLLVLSILSAKQCSLLVRVSKISEYIPIILTSETDNLLNIISIMFQSLAFSKDSFTVVKANFFRNV